MRKASGACRVISGGAKCLHRSSRPARAPMTMPTIAPVERPPPPPPLLVPGTVIPPFWMSLTVTLLALTPACAVSLPAVSE